MHMKEMFVYFPKVIAVFKKVSMSENCQSLLLFINASYSRNREGLLLTCNKNCRFCAEISKSLG